jgi:DNA-binding MarR family transcriptional regulator
VTAAEARRAGFDSKEALLRDLRSGGDRKLYRVTLRLAGPDRREALRNAAKLTKQEAADIRMRLARYDGASRRNPWTDQVLRLIAKHPETSAGELAELSGFDKAWLKINVRKLKELGLTESLQPGYRLSPRGREFLKRK